jgi:predicted nucleotidyltransferase
MNIEAKIMELFFEYPRREFYLREVSREVGVSVGAAKKYLDRLVEKRLLLRRVVGNLYLFRSNREHPIFKQKMLAYNTEKLFDSGVVDRLLELEPTSIILYGSFARGENDENSDIDVLVISEKKDVPSFRGILDREVNVSVYSEAEWNNKAREDKAFYEQVIIYGVPLYGKKPVVL